MRVDNTHDVCNHSANYESELVIWRRIGMLTLMQIINAVIQLIGKLTIDILSYFFDMYIEMFNRQLERQEKITTVVHDIPTLQHIKNIANNKRIILDTSLSGSGALRLSTLSSRLTCKDLVDILKAESEKLEYIMLDGEDLQNIITHDIPIMPKLDYLDLSGSSITATSLISLLEKTPNLSYLHINKTHILDIFNDHGIELQLSKLKEFWAHDATMNSPIYLAILKQTHNLKRLEIVNCHSIERTILNNLVPLQQLRAINLRGSDITGAGLFRLFTKAPNLIKVDIYNCEKFTIVDKIKINRFRMNNPSVRLRVSFEPNNFTEAMLGSDNLLEHFSTLLNSIDIDVNNARYNLLARISGGRIPSELIMMIENCVGNELDREIKVLKNLFPGSQAKIIEFQNSENFKDFILTFNENVKDAVTLQKIDSYKMNQLLMYYRGYRKYTTNFTCFKNDNSRLEPSDNPFQLVKLQKQKHSL